MIARRTALAMGLVACLVCLANMPLDSLAADGPTTAAATTTSSAPATAASKDWPRWRGPRGDNAPVVEAFPQDLTKLTKKWSTTQLCTGKAELVATWSCPVIAGKKLVVTGREDTKDTVWCLDAATGEKLWKKEYDAPAGKNVPYGNGPRATPAIDGDFVYTFGCMGQVACWSLADGKQQWIKNVEDLGGKRPLWGHSSSPLIVGDKVIVQGGGKALVVALDKKTGDKAWTSLEGPAGYAAPMIATLDGKDQLVVFAAETLLGLDPKDGGKLWSFPWPTGAGMNCSTPIQLGEKLLIVSSEKDFSGQKGGMALLEFTSGQPKAAWKNQQVGPGHNEPAIVDGFFYAFTGFSMDKKGSLICADLATGKAKWTSNDIGGPGTVIRVGDQLLALGNGGKLALIKPSSEKIEIISSMDAIKGFPVWTGAVIADGRLYIRSSNELICYTWN